MELGEAEPLDMILHPFEKCPNTFMPRCSYNGQYGIVNNLNYSQIAKLMKRKEKLHVFYPDQPQHKVSLNLIDSRVGTPQHRLAVCPPPLSQFAVWAILPRFFEVRTKMYEHDKTIEIERVPWGYIPLPENTPEEEDPNKEVHRAEHVLVWNDCILRSRGKTEYLALADFDEVFVLYNNQSFLSFLDSLLEKKPKAGSFSFLSVSAYMQHTYLDATDPTQIQFNDHYEFKVDNKAFRHGSMSKVVVIPERVESEAVHESLRMEKPFTEHIVDPKIGKLLHLRLRPMEMIGDLLIPTTDVAKYVPAWDRRYKKIINDEIERLKSSTGAAELTLKTNQWKNNGFKVMLEADNCFEALESEDKVCPTRYRCLARLRTMKYNEWVHGGSSWVAL
ncbi:unnamed protein product [Enterobius vermicularis]|uniref:Glycosyltransferase family 92 protein n=1 Tax=Enterobius vermicularis TaxID=51028 RepID=A0A158Q9S7_ENTVE|nr:unnamed protein product [Enterobius vermicularis]